MQRLLFAIVLCMCGAAAIAACPTTSTSYVNFEEVHMDNFVLTGSGESCPAGTVEYFDINEMCDAHIY